MIDISSLSIGTKYISNPIFCISRADTSRRIRKSWYLKVNRATNLPKNSSEPRHYSSNSRLKHVIPQSTFIVDCLVSPSSSLPCSYHSTISLLPRQHLQLAMKRRKHEAQLTLGRRRLAQAHTAQMEPLLGTRIIIARHHLAVTDSIAVAVPRLILIHLFILSLDLPL